LESSESSLQSADFVSTNVNTVEDGTVQDLTDSEEVKVLVDRVLVDYSCFTCEMMWEAGRVINMTRCEGCLCLNTVFPSKMCWNWMRQLKASSQAALGSKRKKDQEALEYFRKEAIEEDCVILETWNCPWGPRPPQASFQDQGYDDLQEVSNLTAEEREVVEEEVGILKFCTVAAIRFAKAILQVSTSASAEAGSPTHAPASVSSYMHEAASGSSSAAPAATFPSAATKAEEVTGDMDHDDLPDWDTTTQLQPGEDPFTTKELIDGKIDNANPAFIVSAGKPAAYEELLADIVDEPDMELEENLEVYPLDPYSVPKVVLRRRADAERSPPPLIGDSAGKPAAVEDDDEYKEEEIVEDIQDEATQAPSETATLSYLASLESEPYSLTSRDMEW
jgi:hypothetical protein